MIFYDHNKSSMCTRCGLQYSCREKVCPHCKDVSDLDAVYLRKNFKAGLSGLSSAMVNLFVAGFVAVALLMLAISW